MALACVSPAWGCSIGSGLWEQDFAQALRSNPQAFVAQLVSYDQVPPAPGDDYYINQMRYVVVEVIKGEPDAVGMLGEHDPGHVRPGRRPGASCGPWLTGRDNVGRTAVVFAKRETRGGHTLLWADAFSRIVEPGDPGSDEMLQLIRTLAKEESQAK